VWPDVAAARSGIAHRRCSGVLEEVEILHPVDGLREVTPSLRWMAIAWDVFVWRETH
jgi:hypothetical protein